MGFQFEAALEGRLDEARRQVIDDFENALMAGMEEIRDRGLRRLRSSLKQAGLGKIEKSWRGEVYPKRGKKSLEPAVHFYTNAPMIIQANQGEVIRSKNAQYLAVPVPNGFAKNFPVRQVMRWGGRVRYAQEKFGDKLFTIPAKGTRPAILAVKDVRVDPKSRRLATRRARRKYSRVGRGQIVAGENVIFLFWLVPQVTMPKRLDTKRDFEIIEQMFHREFPGIVARHFANSESGRS